MNVPLSTAILGVGATALAIYLIDVWFPSLFRSLRNEVDLEEAKEEVKKEKVRIKKEGEAVQKENDEVRAQVAAIQAESVADEKLCEKKIKEVNKDSDSVKEFLEGEGFNVEEIYPE